MKGIELRPVADLMPEVGRVLEAISRQLSSLCPDAEFHHIGATAVPGSLTKGDIDVLIRTTAESFQGTVNVLKKRFSVKQPENWTATFASFGDDHNFDLPLGIQVVVKNSSDDFLLFLRDYLIAHPEMLARYNELKTSYAGKEREEYWKAKDKFFAAILSAHR